MRPMTSSHPAGLSFGQRRRGVAWVGCECDGREREREWWVRVRWQRDGRGVGLSAILTRSILCEGMYVAHAKPEHVLSSKKMHSSQLALEASPGTVLLPQKVVPNRDVQLPKRFPDGRTIELMIRQNPTQSFGPLCAMQHASNTVPTKSPRCC